MTSKSGILKKSNYEQRSPVDFLVFGYQCKLYRDDIKAIEFDRETHLIPAPYEPKDLISRYDVRATLSEISPYECSSSVLNRLDGLSAAEQQAELLAEKERYFSLYINEVEEELYKEEEIKRLSSSTSGYNQVQFSYDDDDDNAKDKIGPKESSDIQQDNENDDNDSDDASFTPSESLKLPPDIKVPSSMKLNQIIEKTAKFIASQGLQMEILLKTKQAANPQFNFLNHDGQYNSYYKHILSMMKNNTYPWQEILEKSNSNSMNDQNESSNSNDTNENAHTTIVIPKLQYKPSHDCYYTQLISKITKAPISELERKQQEEEDANKAKNIDSNAPKISSGLLGLSNYNSDSDSNEEEENDVDNSENDKFNGVVPPSDIQKVIDTTAVYVAKNGTHFEQKLMEKIHTDTRFEFIHDNNKYHSYYKMKVKSYLPNNTTTTLGTITKSSNPSTTTINSVTTIEPTSIAKAEIDVPKAPPAPVCFSIKIREERPPLKNARIDNSDDEKNSAKIPDAPSPPRITSVEEELERQVDIINAEREEKLLKERLNEKLLSAAREKLGMLPKEKMLQIERKKRAMMFINQIKGSNGSTSNSGNRKEDDVINLTLCGEESNDSAKSRSSSIKRTYNKNKSESRSRSRKRSSRSSRSSSSSRSRSYSSRSSDSSPRRKRSKKHKSKSKKKYRRSTRSRSRSKSKSSSKKKYSKC